MDHDGIVEPWLDRCQGFSEDIVQAPDLHSVARPALTILAQMRPVARHMLHAKITLEVQQLTHADLPPCCPEAAVTLVHPRTVSPETLCGEISIPVRTFQCRGCGTRRFGRMIRP